MDTYKHAHGTLTIILMQDVLATQQHRLADFARQHAVQLNQQNPASPFSPHRPSSSPSALPLCTVHAK